MTLFKNTFRIESIRLKGYDYSSPGEYFVTICTKGIGYLKRNRESSKNQQIKSIISPSEWFGKVENGIMRRNDIGEIAHQVWMEIPIHHENAILDEFVIMPNHVHGIIVLRENNNGRDVAAGVINATHGRDVAAGVINATHGRDVAAGVINTTHGRDVAGNVSTTETKTMAGISPKRGSLGAIIRSYKSAVSNWCHANGYHHFQWQSRFYEHIIRSEKDLDNIREYIVNNPIRWYEDEKNPANIDRKKDR